MKIRMLCLLLLAACTEPEVSYQYSLTWTCVSPDGCERTEVVTLIDRLNINGSSFFFISRRDADFDEDAQRVASDSLPDGCSWLYAFSLFGHELESATVCDTEDGFEMEFSVPNANPVTHSEWLVVARDLGPW